MSKNERQRKAEKQHRAKVRANEDEVIEGANELDPNDKSERAEYIRDVAEDIKLRRAGADPNTHTNPN